MADRIHHPDQHGIRSIVYLVHLRSLPEERGAGVVNVGVLIEAEPPEVRPHFLQMWHNIARPRDIFADRVGINGVTCDGLGLMAQVIAAQAVVVAHIRQA